MLNNVIILLKLTATSIRFLIPLKHPSIFEVITFGASFKLSLSCRRDVTRLQVFHERFFLQHVLP